MAKKSRSKPYTKASRKPKPVRAAQDETAPVAPVVSVEPPQPALEIMQYQPAVAVHRTYPPTLVVAVAVLSCLLLLASTAWLAGISTDTPAYEVKSQHIPLTLDDFKDDPTIQHAIEKQLGGNGMTSPSQTPQAPTQSPQPAGGQLQSAGNQLQP